MSREVGAGDGTTEASTSGVDNHVSGLAPGSYTAQRLHHASARHLHLTTRRVFIGPIPQAWISSHRKSWFKYRPRMLTYSSKTATFNAAENVSDLRALTGLDLPDEDKTSKKIGLSFPQPEDVDDEDNGPEAVPIPEFTNAGKVAASDPREEERAADDSKLAVQDPKGSTSQTHTRGMNGSSEDAKSYKTAKENKEGSKSFVTARESRDKLENSGEEPRSVGEEAVTDSPTTTTSTENRNSGSTTGQLNAIGEGLRKTDSGAESTSSLIPHHESVERESSAAAPASPTTPIKTGPARNLDGQRSPTPERLRPERQHSQIDGKDRRSRGSSNQVLLDVPPEAYDDGDQDSAPLRTVDPVSTGLVRFNIPEDLANKGAKAKGKVAEVKSKVPFPESRKSKAEPGQLLKAERMLVRVESTKHDIPDDYSENDSLKAETTVIEKWREFIVTCRKSAGDDTEFILQMNKTRVIPMVDIERQSKRSSHVVVLQRRVTKVNLFSTLDKTIVIWVPYRGKSTRIYLFRPRSPASSVEWYTFLNYTLGWQSPPRLRLHVPDLDVTLELDNPLNDADVLKHPIEGPENEPGDPAVVGDGEVARDIISQALKMLTHSDFQDILDTWAEHGERIGLAWKRYDRLEWVHGANEERMYGSMAMQKTHDLELRPKKHYPTDVPRSLGEDHLVEPTPIEGFLVRQTSQKGRGKRFGKTFFKRLYFSTHNHFLCFSTPGKALPPKPPELLKTAEGSLPQAAEIAKQIPLIYSVDPFPIHDGQISWTSESNSKRKKLFDQLAYEESERSIRLLLEAEGYINLCHVVRVHRLKSKSAAPPEQGVTISNDDSDEEAEDENQTEDEVRTFEILLNNGLRVRLQAFDKRTRKEWVKRLGEISEYWKVRTAGDMELYKQVRQSNLENLHIDEEMESFIGQTAQKWEVSKSVASPELFHMCGISCCRQVTLSGVLYRKPRVHSSFRKCVVILCHGKLLIFQSTLRNSAGREIPHILHEREQVVDLKDTYIYSGLVTEGDLLYQNRTFDSNHPGHSALPRVYREDNWTSIDEDTTTCFVVWHGRRKSFFRANADAGDGTIKSSLKYVSSLGVPGRAMVFKTRSRAERDHWVMSISMEIERLQQAEDIRVVVKK